jgi:hypothetical protein
MKYSLKYINYPENSTLYKCLRVKEEIWLRLLYAQKRVFGDFTHKKIDVSWVGQPYRFDLANALIERTGYQRYLEIGCFKDQCFSRIKCAHKTGADPVSGGTLRMTSDEFFAQNTEKFDLIFIDGLHVYEQVRKDILSALDCLNEGGTVMVHDCLPVKYSYQTVPGVGKIWNGDVGRAFVELRTWDHLDAAVCIIDNGVGMIRVRPNRNKLELDTTDFKALKYADLADNYRHWLNTRTYAEALDFLR